MGASALSILVGVVGGVLLVLAVLRARRSGVRPTVGVAGAGLLLVGLSLSGLVEVLSRALALLSFNPLRWAGLAAAVLGVLMLSWAGMLPGRRRSRRETTGEDRPRQARSKDRPREVSEGREKPPPADEDLAEIEDILRRRGIQ